MKRLIFLIAVGLIALPFTLKAQENKPTERLTPEQLKSMTPEERSQKIRELREKRGRPGGIAEQRRLDAESMTPEEQANRMQVLGLNRDEVLKLSPQDRQAKIRESIQTKYEELQKKKKDGTALTEEETKFVEFIDRRNKDVQAERGPRIQLKGQVKTEKSQEKKSEEKPVEPPADKSAEAKP
jgi:hypothetical protein